MSARVPVLVRKIERVCRGYHFVEVLDALSWAAENRIAQICDEDIRNCLALDQISGIISLIDESQKSYHSGSENRCTSSKLADAVATACDDHDRGEIYDVLPRLLIGMIADITDETVRNGLALGHIRVLVFTLNQKWDHTGRTPKADS